MTTVYHVSQPVLITAVKGHYRAHDKGDLNALDIALAARPLWQVLAHVHYLGLMRSRQFRFLFWLIKAWRGLPGMENFFFQFNKRSPDTVNDWFADTLHHLHFGKDTEDKTSVGGWSQREINLLVASLKLDQ